MALFIKITSQKNFISTLALTLLLMTACSQANPTSNPLPTAAQSPTTEIIATHTPFLPTTSPSPLPPSPTPAPLAARVNNEGITLEEYNNELQRLQAALKETGKEMNADEQKQTVLQELEDQMLLAQSAIKGGFQLSDVDFQKRLEDVITRSGGAQAFSDWLKRNFYDDVTYRSALRRALAATWQRDQLIARVPTAGEQVHARQILVLNEDLANSLYKQLQAGADFATLSLKVDPESGGELGWFPRGYLFLPEIENVAFNLQPGNYSPVIKTAYGFHIVFVIERDPNHSLLPDARLQFQRSAINNWLKDRRAQSQIEILLK